MKRLLISRRTKNSPCGSPTTSWKRRRNSSRGDAKTRADFFPGEELVLDFRDEEGGLQGKVICSQDSKWFAYALLLGPRVTETRICLRSGDRFEKLKTEYLGVDPDGDVGNEYVKPLRWVKPGTLVLEQFSIFRGGVGDAKIQFTADSTKTENFAS